MVLAFGALEPLSLAAAALSRGVLVAAAGVVVVLAILLVFVMVLRGGSSRQKASGLDYDAAQGPVGQPQAPGRPQQPQPGRWAGDQGGEGFDAMDQNFGQARPMAPPQGQGWQPPFGDQQAANNGAPQWGAPDPAAGRWNDQMAPAAGPMGGQMGGQIGGQIGGQMGGQMGGDWGAPPANRPATNPWDAPAGGPASSTTPWGAPAQANPWDAPASAQANPWDAPVQPSQPAWGAPQSQQAPNQGGWSAPQQPQQAPGQPAWGAEPMPSQPAWGGAPQQAPSQPAWGVQPQQPSQPAWGGPPQPAQSQGAWGGAPAGLPRLIERKPDGSGREFDLRKERLTIGRHRESDVFLEDLAVSRLHTTVTHDPSGRYIVRDENSANGTYVNGQRITEHLLQEGDEVQVGQSVLVFTQR